MIVWQFAGYSMVIFLANLEGIPDELLEASRIDGAGTWARFRYVVWPLLGPAITINVMLSTIGGLKLFDQIFAATNGGPGYSTETLSTIIYKQAFVFGDYGYSTAIAFVLGAVRRRRLARPDPLPARSGGRVMSHLRYGRSTFLLEVVMIAAAIAFLFPVYALVTLSFKDAGQIANTPLALPKPFTTDNFSDAWSVGLARRGAGGARSIVTVISVLLLIVIGSVAAYWLARRRTSLSYGLYILFLLGIVLPFQLGTIPLFKLIGELGWIGSYQG